MTARAGRQQLETPITARHHLYAIADNRKEPQPLSSQKKPAIAAAKALVPNPVAPVRPRLARSPDGSLVFLNEGPSIERVVSNVTTRATAAELEVPYVGAGERFPEHRVYDGPKTDWVLGPAETDPLYRRRDAVPKEQRDRIRRIQRVLDFPEIYVAHEIEKVGNTVPAIRHSGYRELTPAVASQAIALPAHWSQTATRRLWDGVQSTARQLDRGIAAADRQLTAGAASLRNSVTRSLEQAALRRALDPMVFGVMPIPELPGIGAWFLLARWDA